MFKCLQLNVQIFIKILRRHRPGSVIPFLFNSLLTDTLQEGHLVFGQVVLTKFKIMYPDKFTPLAIQQHVIEAWRKVSSLLIFGSGGWPQREALALSLFLFTAENTKNLPLALRARAREKI